MAMWREGRHTDLEVPSRATASTCTACGVLESDY